MLGNLPTRTRTVALDLHRNYNKTTTVYYSDEHVSTSSRIILNMKKLLN